MNWIVDRIENDIAVCEIDGEMIHIPLFALPHGTHEGDVIALEIDIKETQNRQKNITNLMNKLFKD